jgi:osmotically-inducible protein OsmY
MIVYRTRRFATARLLTVAVLAFMPSTAIGAAAAGAMPLPPGRCDGVVGDSAATFALQSRLTWSAAIDAADVRIVTVGGVTEIRGLVRSEAQRILVGEVARDTYGVERVDNQLDVNDWAPVTDHARENAVARNAERVREHGKRRSDAWIAAALTYTFSFSRTIDSCRIGVESADGKVSLRGTSLRGTIASAAARDSAIALAHDTLGVRSATAVALVTE